MDLGLANASVYLDLVGHTVVGLDLVETGPGRGEESRQRLTRPDRDFYQGKLQACAFFFRWELPKTRPVGGIAQ